MLTALIWLTAFAAPPPPADPTPRLLPTARFGSFTAGCDNRRHCSVAGPEGLDILREAGPDGEVRVFDRQHGWVRGRRELAVDGIAVPQAPSGAWTGTEARAVVDALLRGQGYAYGPRARAIPIAGLADALRWVDRQQGRTGTVTALVDPGARPAARVPSAAAAPIIRVPSLPAEADQGTIPPETLVASAAAIAGCEPWPQMRLRGWSERVDASTRIVTISGCRDALGTNIAFIERGGQILTLRFDLAPDGVVAGRIVRAALLQSGTLVIAPRVEGQSAQCRDVRRYAWDGARLRLIGAALSARCHGVRVDERVPLWHAEVRRSGR